jgi:hypothetical protein
MFPVKPRENVIPIETELEANFLEEVLRDRDIPHVFISYHDSAFNGIYQMQHGWGHVEVPKEHAEEVKRLYEEVKASSPEPEEEDMIEVQKQDENTFLVKVTEGGGSSSHTVTLTDEYYQKLSGGKVDKETLIERSFEFLLERESKESILGRFELPVISRYFPEYEKTIGKRL